MQPAPCEPTPSQLQRICQPTGSRLLHRVSPGDTLSAIVRDYYQPEGHSLWMKMVDQIARDNQHIPNPNIIYPGQVVYLRQPFQFGRPHPAELADAHECQRIFQSSPTTSFDSSVDSSVILALFSGFSSALGWGTQGVLKESESLVQQVVGSYKQFKMGKISKHAHYSNRSRLLFKQAPKSTML